METSTFTVMECNRWKSAVLTLLQLHWVWLPLSRAVAICGTVGTSPPAPIGHPRHPKLSLDGTRHGSGIETMGQAGDIGLCNRLRKPNKDCVRLTKEYTTHSCSQTPQQGGSLQMHRPLKVQSGNAAVQPMRLLGLCTEQSIPQTPSLQSLIEIFQQQVKE